jgi:PhzF family phenazine biosynthesis protein
MQQLTQEMRQFESIFLSGAEQPGQYHARVFTMEEELDFAGHPVLGAAGVLHYLHTPNHHSAQWKLILPAKTVQVTTEECSTGYKATMNQGQPDIAAPVSIEQSLPFLQALNLTVADLAEGYPLQVISTGLPYLIVPLQQGLDRCQILHPQFESLLKAIGAKFVYVFDLNTFEGRTWDNAGLVEDIATGSAAGPAGVYLVAHHIAPENTPIVIHQGRFVGRPSQMAVQVAMQTGTTPSVLVSGQVCLVASGSLF